MYLYVMSYECLVVTQMERCENAVVTLRALGEKGIESDIGRERGNYTPAFKFFSVWIVSLSTYHEGCQMTIFMGKDVEKPIFRNLSSTSLMQLGMILH